VPVAIPISRDVVRVAGPEATAYLQGQLSQDVEALALDTTTWSFVLQPTGKVEAWVRVTRTADDVYLLDLDGGWGDAVAARLRRFLLRTKAEVELLDWECLALRGEGAAAVSDLVGEVRAQAGWPDVEGVDLLGPGLGLLADVPPSDLGTYHALRIAAGVPAMGAELTEKTIPAEVGQWVVDASVSFTKGCYTGQELVARIHSRGGNVPRHLRGLVVEGRDVPPAGASVVVDGAEVGTVTSAALSADLDAPVALAYVGRAVTPPVDATITSPEGSTPAHIHELPLYRRTQAGHA
jgi:tRNA-modifying protein YgfZ